MMLTTGLAVLLVTTAPVPPPPPVQATITEIVDGDIIAVDILGTPATVRLIGIDTPPTGSPCGDAVATFVADLLPVGAEVILTAGAVDSQDQDGHLLRYITFTNPDEDPGVQGDETVDLGIYLLGDGLAEPGYDSTDGHGPHPLEEVYRSIEASPVLAECVPDASAPTPTTAADVAQPTPTAAEPTVPPEYTNALRTAEDYLDYTAFSQSGLVEQLEYEQYSTEAAQWAVENVEVDWNEQAALSAEQYLDYTAFSEGGLRDQLAYEGFTPEQIEFAIAEMKAQGRL